MDWVVESGVEEICFKELYVASSQESIYYNNETNIWSRNNQISLNLIIEFMQQYNGKIIERLPWGSPIYHLHWKNCKLTVVAYTEPSIYWERSNGICRSWNIMADGQCYASLEDRNSLIY